jgi:AcrR family transcriptional regulator
MPQKRTLQPNQLTAKQLRAIEFLVTQQRHETMDDIAKKAGVNRTTIYRWLGEERFYSELKSRVTNLFRGARAKIANALINGAVEGAAAPGQAGMQRIFWQLVGELKEGIEISGPNGEAIRTHNDKILEYATLEEKMALATILEPIYARAGLEVSDKSENNDQSDLGEDDIDNDLDNKEDTDNDDSVTLD